MESKFKFLPSDPNANLLILLFIIMDMPLGIVFAFLYALSIDSLIPHLEVLYFLSLGLMNIYILKTPPKKINFSKIIETSEKYFRQKGGMTRRLYLFSTILFYLIAAQCLIGLILLALTFPYYSLDPYIKIAYTLMIALILITGKILSLPAWRIRRVYANLENDKNLKINS